MSEELIARGLLKGGISVVDYEYFPTHSTTIKQYKQAKIINNFAYGLYEKRKPDGLLVDRRNSQDINVILLLEYKKPSDFQTDKQKTLAIQQCNDLCQVVNSKIGIITDGIVTLWINPRCSDSKNDYQDKTTRKKRSYSFILNEDKQKLNRLFVIAEDSIDKREKLDDASGETYDLIKRILQEISETNSTLTKTKEVDPLNLAKSVWQDIYVNTGKDPTKCLYNVVEIFIFKFLSDLDVLKPPYDFKSLLNMYEHNTTNKEVLEFYARNSRLEIRKLFPAGSDGTTIINGTIFVDNDGNPVEAQANLFKNSLNKYAAFDSLKNIRKEFKTKLFEVFLKQSKDKSRLGQFFTPRKVVRAVVEMADVDSAEFICDPFCGVGGFLLEPLQFSTKLKNQFQPSFSQRKQVRLLGLDKGSDDDEYRTIILAKANMLIYLSDIVEKNTSLSAHFSEIFNKTFKLLTDSNLGTLKIKFDREDEKPDLILSNPPYVKKGSSSLRSELVEENLSSEFKNSGVGVEGLAVKWIINNLRSNGRAFFIVPNGILDNMANKDIRNELKKTCYINCIISLPIKTFFNTPKKTYIIGIQKKNNSEDIQGYPVFTYLVSSIGEKLNVNRFEIEDNDLEKAKNLFNQFKGNKNNFSIDDPRCKLIPYAKFEKSKYWIIENFWSEQEQVSLGIKKKKTTINIRQYNDLLSNLIESIEGYKGEIKGIEREISNVSFVEKKFTDIFDIHLGEAKYTKEYINEHKGTYPVYSAQTLNNGEIGKINSFDWDVEGLTWSIDGSYPGMVFYRNGKFNMTCHCGLLVIKPEHKPLLDYGFLLYLLNNHLPQYEFGQGNKRLKKTHLEQDIGGIRIPIGADKKFDLAKQKQIANKYEVIEKINKQLKEDHERIMKFGVLI